MTKNWKNSGIYCLLNTFNNHIYIGSSINLNVRKSTHFQELRKNKHYNSYLQRAFNLHPESFVFVVLFNCEPDNTLEFEQIFIDTLQPDYNMSKSSTAPMKGRKHSEKTKLLFKNKFMPKGKDNWNYGRKHSEEICEKHRQLRLGWIHPDHVKKKMSETSKRLNRASDLDKIRHLLRSKIKDSLNNEFESVTAAAKFHNMSASTVCDILNGRHKSTRSGISFVYLYRSINNMKNKDKGIEIIVSDGDTTKTYSSIRAICIDLKINRSSLNKKFKISDTVIHKNFIIQKKAKNE